MSQWNTKPALGSRLSLTNSILSNLYYFYALNDNSSQITDLFHSHIIGTLKSGVTWNSQQLGICPDFNGTTGYIDLGVINPNLNINGFSVSSWVYFHSLPTSTLQMLWSRYDTALGKSFNGSYLAAFDQGTNNPKPRFAIAVSNGTFGLGIQGTTTLLTNTWYNLTGTWNGITGDIKIYLNGNLETAGTNIIGTMYNNATRTLLGARSNGAGAERYLNGMLDFSMAWLRELTASEVSYLASRMNWYKLFLPPNNPIPKYQYVNPIQPTSGFTPRVLIVNYENFIGHPLMGRHSTLMR